MAFLKADLLTFKSINIGTVVPPHTMTVLMVMRQVVVKNICRTSVTVFRTDNAKAMAPRRPENQSMC